MKKFIKWVPSLIVMATIFFSSSTPGQTLQEVGLGNEWLHRTGHFLAFLFLCLSYFYATRNIVISMVLTVVYGFFDESHQIYTPLRSASWFDIKVDILGAVIGGLTLWILQKSKIWPKILQRV